MSKKGVYDPKTTKKEGAFALFERFFQALFGNLFIQNGKVFYIKRQMILYKTPNDLIKEKPCSICFQTKHGLLSLRKNYIILR